MLKSNGVCCMYCTLLIGKWWSMICYTGCLRKLECINSEWFIFEYVERCYGTWQLAFYKMYSYDWTFWLWLILSILQCGKACLGDTIYHYISAEKFSPECILDCLDISSEYQALEIANRIEGAINLWNKKFYKNHPNRKKTQKPSWIGKVKGLVGDAEKSHKVMHRAECLLQSLKIRYPALPQSLLDMTKIQYNKVHINFLRLLNALCSPLKFFIFNQGWKNASWLVKWYNFGLWN